MNVSFVFLIKRIVILVPTIDTDDVPCEDEEDETDVHETLQAIRGTELMEYMKEVALGQEQDHQKLLAAIRKVEETELQENDTKMTSVPETDKENNNEGTTEEKPLSYYL